MTNFTSTTAGIVLSVAQSPGTIVAGATVTNTTTQHSGDGVYGSNLGAFNLTNLGTVNAAAPASAGVYLGGGSATVTNAAGALISGGEYGVYIYEAGGSTNVTNSGTIRSTGLSSVGALLFPGAGGTIVNNSSGAIIGVKIGAEIEYTGGTIANSGTIIGTGTAGVGVYLADGSTLTNAGTIIGQGGTAVAFGTIVNVGGSSGNRLIVDPGAYFKGSISGGAGVLELAVGNGSAGSLRGFGSTITNFGTLQFDNGATWSIEGSATGLPGIIVGFTVGDTIDVDSFAAVSDTFSNNALVLTDTAANHVTLGIQGNFSSSAFALSPDGHGGTNLATTGGTYITGTVNGGIRLGTISQNPVSVTASGVVTNSSTANNGDGIYGSTAAAWTIANAGTVQATGVSSSGIYLKLGGTINNLASGYIAGVSTGVDIVGAAGLVVNAGVIEATGSGAGVYLKSGSTLLNSGSIIGRSGTAVTFGAGAAGVSRLIVDPGGYFQGNISGGSGVLELASGNFIGSLYGFGSAITNFGTVQFDNGSQWLIGGSTVGLPAVIAGFTTNDEIDIDSFVAASETFANNALVLTGTAGNKVTLGIKGSFSSSNFLLSPDGSGQGTLIDFAGTSGGGGNGTYFNGTSTSGISLTGTPQNPVTLGASAYLTNTGTQQNGDAIYGGSATAWSIGNLGKIKGGSGSAADGIHLISGGTITNGVSGSTAWLIAANRSGIEIDGAIGTVTNFGTVATLGTSSATVYLKAGGVVTNFGSIIGMGGGSAAGVMLPTGTLINEQSGLIQGSNYGIGGLKGLAENYGTIIGSRNIVHYGTLINRGVISGSVYGIQLGLSGSANGTGVLATSGTVKGKIGIAAAPNITAGYTVTVAGTVIGTSGTAVSLAPHANNRLILQVGETFQGIVNGGSGGTNVLEIALPSGIVHTSGGSAYGSTAVPLQINSITNFGTVQVDNGATTFATGTVAAGVVFSVLNIGTGGSSGGPTIAYFNNFNLTFANSISFAVGQGEIVLSGGSLTSSALQFYQTADDLLSGFGTLNVSLGTIGGPGMLNAAGGLLDVSGTIASGVGLQITGGNLKIEGITTAAAAIAFNPTPAGVTGAVGASRAAAATGDTLEIGAAGAMTIATAQSLGVGDTIQLDGGMLSDGFGVTLGAGANLLGLGTVTGPLSGGGLVLAIGGTLELTSAIGNAAGPSFQIGNSAIDVLKVDSAVGPGNTFTFQGAAGALAFGNDSGLAATIAGLNVGSGGAETNFVDIEGHPVTINSVTGQGSTSGTIALSDGAVLNLTGLNSTAWFAHAVSDGSGGTDVFVSDTPCFCRGTLILTERGEVPAETLAIGDRVMTLAGVARPIKWIGRRSYGGRFAFGQKQILPVCIRAGALADGVPRRDLWISPNHAMYLGGVLIEARDLVNHASIYQADQVESIEYFHLELGSHDVIVAEGAFSESFIDDDNRGLFHNAHEYWNSHPHERPTPAQYYAPRREEGFEVQQVRAEIGRRAGLAAAQEIKYVGRLRGNVDDVNPWRISGWAQDFAHREVPVCLELVDNGVVIAQTLANRYRPELKAAGVGSGRHGFEFLPGETAFTIGSIEVRRVLDRAVLPMSVSLSNNWGGGADSTIIWPRIRL